MLSTILDIHGYAETSQAGYTRYFDLKNMRPFESKLDTRSSSIKFSDNILKYSPGTIVSHAVLLDLPACDVI